MGKKTSKNGRGGNSPEFARQTPADLRDIIAEFSDLTVDLEAVAKRVEELPTESINIGSQASRRIALERLGSYVEAARKGYRQAKEAARPEIERADRRPK